jgi:electron transport complex protein RnfD
MSERALDVRPGPFLHSGLSTRRVMFEVVAAIVPVVAFATYHFGVVALVTCLSTCAGALSAERLTAKRPNTLRDGSALITGLLLALTLPPALPQWMSFLGGAVGILVGKAVFGGLGQNPFNPALVGRAFLQAAFPTALTTWTLPAERLGALPPSSLALPFARGAPVDAISAATPLGMSKFQHELTAIEPLLWGNTAGSLGETSAVLLVGIGLWLVLRQVADFRLFVSPLASAFVFSAALHVAAPDRHPPPLFMLLSGGLLFGAVFMVTDPVTSPVTARGAWIYGSGVGLLVVLIRAFGGLPEGVMYSVLLMNATVPLIDRRTQPTPFGGVVRR